MKCHVSILDLDPSIYFKLCNVGADDIRLLEELNFEQLKKLATLGKIRAEQVRKAMLVEDYYLSREKRDRGWYRLFFKHSDKRILCRSAEELDIPIESVNKYIKGADTVLNETRLVNLYIRMRSYMLRHESCRDEANFIH